MYSKVVGFEDLLEDLMPLRSDFQNSWRIVSGLSLLHTLFMIVRCCVDGATADLHPGLH